MENFYSVDGSTTDEKSVGRQAAEAFAISAAAAGGTIAGLLAAGYAVSLISEWKENRKKKTSETTEA
jgi:putative effector of murein hydrolase LrgA (UPF0299 family)